MQFLRLPTLSTVVLCSFSFHACATSPEHQGSEAKQPLHGRWLVYPGADGPGKGKQVLLIAGDEEYRSEEALPQIARILAFRHGFDCTVLFSQNEEGLIDPDARRRIPGLELIAQADMVVLFTRFRELADEDMAWFNSYIEAGKPLFGIRTATHAFHYPNDLESSYRSWRWNAPAGGFGVKILGETWVNHHGKHGSESTRGVVVANHPIVRGVEDLWGPTDVYGIRELPEDATVLVEGAVLDGMDPSSNPVADERNHPRMPIVWIRERAVGAEAQRIICSTIGASVDLQCEDLRRLFVNAVYWGVGLEVEIPKHSAAGLIGSYEPTMFGFGAYRKGVRPASLLVDGPTKTF